MVAIDLTQLQNLTKRDPEAYRAEFLQQLRHFQTLLAIFQLKPNSSGAEAKAFTEQVNYLSQVATCYPEHMADFPSSVTELLQQHCNNLDPDLRRSLAKSLILLRNRGLLVPTALLSLFFQLFRCPDKHLRKLLYEHIVQDIRNCNLKHKDNKLNRTLQNFMFTMLQDASDIAAKKSLDALVELYQRNIWNDTKTVNVIASACFSKHTKVLVKAMKFFVGGQDEEVDDNENANDETQPSSAKDAEAKWNSSFSRKQLSKEKKAKRVIKSLERKKKKALRKREPNFPAIQLLHDPQTFAEKLLRILRTSNQRFEVRMMMMNLISQLISTHKLILYRFYSYLHRYLEPHQQNAAFILAVLAQSCHELVDPDVLLPVVTKLLNHFVSDRSRNEVMSVGLNAIREICARQPLIMTAEVMGDIAQYKNFKQDKGVAMAARGIINLFRIANPGLLARKDKGKEGAMNTTRPLAFGEVRPSTGVAGVELLQEQLDEEQAVRDGDRAAQVQRKEESTLRRQERRHAKNSGGGGGGEGKEDGGDEDEDDENDEEDDDDEEGRGEEGEGTPKKQKRRKSGGEGNGSGSDSDSDSESEDGDGGEEDEDDGWEMASDDEGDGDDDEGDWIDVSDDDAVPGAVAPPSDDDEDDDGDSKKEAGSGADGVEDDDEAPELVPAKPRLDAIRVLTPKDFERLDALKASAANGTLPKKRKRQSIEPTAEPAVAGQLVDESAIRGLVKRQRQTKEQRVASVMAGREDREKFGSKINRKEKAGGLSNSAKTKSKPFMLTKHSRKVREKTNESMWDKNKKQQLQKKLQRGKGGSKKRGGGKPKGGKK